MENVYILGGKKKSGDSRRLVAKCASFKWKIKNSPSQIIIYLHESRDTIKNVSVHCLEARAKNTQQMDIF